MSWAGRLGRVGGDLLGAGTRHVTRKQGGALVAVLHEDELRVGDPRGFRVRGVLVQHGRRPGLEVEDLDGVALRVRVEGVLGDWRVRC